MTGLSVGDLDVKATTNNGDVYASRILVAVTPDTTAPTPNPYFTTAPNSTTTNMVNMTSVTITDANAVSYFFDSVAGSCGGNAGANGTDSGWISSATYYDTELDVNECYAYQVTGKDAAGNTTATSTASTTYTRAATPGGMTYPNGGVGVTSISIRNTENGNPASNPTTNFVVVASSTDANWDNFYLTGTSPATSTNPTWMSDATIDAITLSGLKQNTLYEFEVVARNQNQILTATSTRTGTTTRPDVTAPTGVSFSSVPNNSSNSQIDMTSTVGSDDTGPISYLFTYTACGTNPGTGGTSSGWQSADTTYSDDTLDVNKCYGYTVTARDSLNNTGSASASSEAYTSANTPSAPTLSAATPATFDIVINANGNPSNTEYAVHFGTPSPDDTDWNGKYLDTDGTPSDTAVWMTKATIDGLASVNGLNELTTYYVEVKARNGDNEETSYSSQSNITTTDGTAPTPSPMTFSSNPNNVSATQIDMTATTASDPSGPVSYNFDSVTGTCGGNAGTGGTDSGWQTSTSYSDSELEVNKCYAYTVQARDTVPNTGTVSVTVQLYTSAAVPSAPTLGSAGATTFGITINANSNPSATEYAVHFGTPSPDDTDWNGKYLDTDGTPSDTAVWMTKATIDAITVSGLNFATTYYVEVKARNGDNEETSYSSQSNISTTGDLTAPTPNPPSFSSAPNNDSISQISMTASAVSDPSTPVEYFFDAVTGSCGANLGSGGTDSAWQTGTGYSDSGLETNKCYAYTLTARDANANTTSASAASQTYTSAAVPGQLTLISRTPTSVTFNNTENGNPSSNPTTQFAILVTSSDSTWNNKYVDASGNPSASAVWRTDAQFDGSTVLGLQPSTSYTFAVKARNGDNEETSFGSNVTFDSAHPPETRLQGIRLQGLNIY
jgi:hypothetical protein